MLKSPTPAAAAGSSVDFTEKLNLNNWTPFYNSLKGICEYKYGNAGKQIIRDRPHTLEPFPKRPTRLDLVMGANGIPLFDYYVYERRDLTAAETALGVDFNTADIRLSTAGATRLDRDCDRYEAAATAFGKHDDELHEYMYSRLSFTSVATIKSHSTYKTYDDAPATNRSYLLFQLLRATHSVGNAQTKFIRTQEFFRFNQESSSYAEYLTTFNQHLATFRSDFESPVYPDHISIHEFASFLFLRNLKTDPRLGRFLDQQYETHPTGRFPDLPALQNSLQTHISQLTLNDMTIDPPSTQAPAAFYTPAATATPSYPPRAPFVRTPGHVYVASVDCPFCLKDSPPRATKTHSADRCHLNPASKNYNKPKSLGKSAAFLTTASTHPPTSPALPSLDAITASVVAAILSKFSEDSADSN
jgi:hypothetical protein